MIVDWKNISSYFKAGDTVYACAFQTTRDKEGKHNYQKPIRGILVLDSSKEKCEIRERLGHNEPRYFVPFKKNGKDLAWSRAVTIYARCFTESESECIDYFNNLIREQIKWHQDEIERLKNEFL